MFSLTNEQRRCFALKPILNHWDRIEAKPSPHDDRRTFLYLDGDTIVKCITLDKNFYNEYELNEKVTPDRKYLLPRTSKGKPVPLTASNIQKRPSLGMTLVYSAGFIDLFNAKTDCAYFNNRYLNEQPDSINNFANWVEAWCRETTDADLKDLARFEKEERRHILFHEGDVFRFKISRREYGYGRVLLDYNKMRKNKEPFWDILMMKPVVCSVYHILTARADVSLEELKPLASLPSTIIADNALYYGEFEIIGNLPITNVEDYPVMYGKSRSALRRHTLCYQCGKDYRTLENEPELFSGFVPGVSFSLGFKADVLRRCIEEHSNAPYWADPNIGGYDLRSPQNADKLQKIRAQFGL